MDLDYHELNVQILIVQMLMIHYWMVNPWQSKVDYQIWIVNDGFERSRVERVNSDLAEVDGSLLLANSWNSTID